MLSKDIYALNDMNKPIIKKVLPWNPYVICNLREKFSNENKWPENVFMSFNCLTVQVNQEIFMKNRIIPLAL